METKTEIIETLARQRVVETMVENIAHQSLSRDLKDLAQEVYMILLSYDEDKILDLHRNDQMRFFIARIIINQYRSSNSPFHATYRKFRERSEDISDYDFIADEDRADEDRQ